jgi:LmbE family N-acetylglucosaminyl deacetylase
MMKILYIFPHPDDESFGPAHAMSKQRRDGHGVYLLTLTRGGATKQRFKYDYSVEKMGEVRFQEMLNVAKALDLTDLTVLDLPDSGLKEMDPREIEKVVIEHVGRIQPDVVVTYAVHGISGFHDHLVSHAVVKRAFLEIRDSRPQLKRLAFFTITEEDAAKGHFHLNGSKPEEIDCAVVVDDLDIERAHNALDCYVTFQDTIEKTGIKNFLQHRVVFEIFEENHEPPLSCLSEGLHDESKG